jgi:hypothetical protein
MMMPSDDDHSKINVVPLEQPKSEIAAAGEALRRSEKVLTDNAAVIARIRRANYLAYIEAGFSDEQALALCTK